MVWEEHDALCRGVLLGSLGVVAMSRLVVVSLEGCMCRCGVSCHVSSSSVVRL